MNNKKEKKVTLEKARLPGREYMEDKPKDCRYCFWWGGKNKQCEHKSCYYLLPLKEKSKEDTGQPGNCKSCPYGKHSPCIGYCTVKLLQEMKEKEQL